MTCTLLLVGNKTWLGSWSWRANNFIFDRIRIHNAWWEFFQADNIIMYGIGRPHIIHGIYRYTHIYRLLTNLTSAPLLLQCSKSTFVFVNAPPSPFGCAVSKSITYKTSRPDPSATTGVSCNLVDVGDYYAAWVGGRSQLEQDCSVSRGRPFQEDKRMVLEHTHGLFIT